MEHINTSTFAGAKYPYAWRVKMWTVIVNNVNVVKKINFRGYAVQ